MLEGMKTHLLVLVALLTIAFAFVSGQVDLATAVQQALAALSVSTLRSGVSGQLNWLSGYKTNLLVVIQVGIIATRFAAGEIDAGTGLLELAGALGLSTMRIGIAAATKTAENG